MAVIKLHNTLTGRLEEFKPIHSNIVTMYHCGPTVYNYAHIGNLRAYIFADILRRTMEYNGFQVKQVVNITDVGELSSGGEDKMVQGLKRENKPITLEGMRELADFYAEAFKKDLLTLNILTPHEFPKASKHIEDQIKLIEKLEHQGLTYKTSDGVYYEVSKFPHYGKLGQLEEEFKKPVDEKFARIEENKEKRNPRDFTLWKFNSELGWESPWGKGFPGWHIECSAMSMKYLGETFDIHTGGIDHIPVHHNNEIAQSEGATHKEFANYWLHSAFLNVSGEKISKSLQNEIYLKDLPAKNIHPLAYRYLLLSGHYSSQMNFSWEALDAAASGYSRLLSSINNYPESGKVNKIYKDRFLSYINHNLDTPRALALLSEIVRDTNLPDADKKTTILEFDMVLGLKLDNNISFTIKTIVVEDKEYKIMFQGELNDNVLYLIIQRQKFKIRKNWTEADTLRTKIEELGYKIDDSSAFDIRLRKLH